MSLLDQLNLGGPTEASGLSPATFAELRRFVYERTGIHFRDNKRYLMESRLKRRLQALGLADFEAYVRYLHAPSGRRELGELVNAVTINETYFFRHAEQHAHFVTELLPDIVEERLSRGQRRVRLWSAACSTGDEPYTLALLILEHLAARYPRITFEIVGSDIDTDVIAKARRGHYSTYAVRNVPPALLRKYFVATTEGRSDVYKLDTRVRRMVTFQQANLSDRAAMQRMRDVDAVFCANVLIYFDQAAKEQVAASLYQSIRDGGYLFVGVSETLYGVTQAFQPVRFAQAVAYRKASARETSGSGLGQPFATRGLPGTDLPERPNHRASAAPPSPPAAPPVSSIGSRPALDRHA